MSAALESRYRARSLWLDGLAEPLLPRPALSGDRDCDVAIVGAGFTGLWAAYFLASLQPDLRVAVVEREIAGFGPSGRNGGWASAGLAGSAQRYARLRGEDAVRRGERAMADGVAEIGRVVADEGIECGWLHSGSLLVATSAPQVARLHEAVERRRSFGMGEDDLRLLEASELEGRVRVRGARAASFTPHCGRVDPARLARGLAQACERRGVIIYEGTEAETI
ncbi:MAG TPA: FAD-dependent oxidoreductase, partial [Gaiellales bacterium]|nr:FAD-dependent oxidoreductase [Gaiellales bacterium]